MAHIVYHPPWMREVFRLRDAAKMIHYCVHDEPIPLVLEAEIAWRKAVAPGPSSPAA